MRIVNTTSNGDYRLNDKHNDAKSSIMVSGVASTAVIKLTYKTMSGNYVEFKDSAIVPGDQVRLDHGTGVKVYATITGASVDTEVEIVCAGID